MFVEYTKKVWMDYENKRAGLPNLLHPSPGRLKDQCLIVCRDRYDKKDDGLLKTFFKKGGDKDSCLSGIDKCEIDTLRPLVYYLNGKTKNPDPIIIELLAWLIDFQPRPYVLGRRYVDKEPTEIEIVSPASEASTVTTSEASTPRGNEACIAAESKVTTAAGSYRITTLGRVSGKPEWRWKFLFGIAAALAIGIVSFLYLTKNNGGGCMYWTGDHYEKVPCEQKMANTLMIALDSERLINFKKITLPDTITYRSKGYVWYIKRKNVPEFFTASGFHPIDIQRQLLPITDYIIGKYCIHPEQPQASSLP